jgi:hypothetical protein
MLGVLSLAVVTYGQGFGTIVGTVTDPSGAVIPSAAVMVRQAGTRLERSTTSNAEGYFVVPSLPPSTYEVEITAPGFQTFVQKNVTIQADQSVTINGLLGIAGTAETVSVSAAQPQVNTTTGTLSQVVDERRIVDMPLNGRNAATLTLLVAGAVQTPSDSVDQGPTKTFPQGVTISTNGSRQSQISYNLDGGNNEDEFTNINQPFPFPDALQEFSVQTSNYSARYGMNAGGVVNVVTKSGTNDRHGDLFEFTRNSALNARNFFAADVDQLKRNQFGGTAGGPLKRNRTFFFAGYQGTLIRNTSSKSVTVPTMANLDGDFSALLNPDDPANPQPGKVIRIIDPATGKPFPGNLIPVKSFDPAALAIAKRLPQVGGNGQFRYIQPLSQNFNEFLWRLDHSFSGQDLLTARHFVDRFTQAAQLDPGNLLTYADSSTIVSQNVLLDEQHIFRAGMLNDLRFSYSSVASDRTPPPDAPSMSSLGVNVFDGGLDAVQSISVKNFFTVGDDPPAQFTRSSFRWSDDVTWVHGRHSLSFGGSIDRSLVDVRNHTNQPGAYTFTSDVTKYAPAAFLLGQMNQFVQGSGQFFSNRNTFVGLYVQDDFHAGRRLTLNFGVRYEPFFPWHSQDGRIMQFNPTAYQNGTRSQVFTNAPPGLVFPGDPGVPMWGYTGDGASLAPRAGFAYDVRGNGQTSLRGGAGVFYDSRVPGITGQTWGSATPFSVTLNVAQPKGPFSNPYLGATNPFPAPSPPPANIAFPTPVSAYTFDASSKYVIPVIYNWNIGVEQQLAPSWLLRLAYVGSLGRHLNEYINLNPATYIPGSTLSTDQRRLFQPFGLIGMFLEDIDSSYNALQVSLEKRLARGLTILANYTLARSFDDDPFNQAVVSMNINLPNLSTIPWNMPGRHDMDYGPSIFDRTHRFVVSYIWSLPTGNRRSRFARELMEGWQLAGVTTAQTGTPVTVVAGADQSQTNLNADRAVMIGSPYGGRACGSTSPCVSYLDPAAFQLPPIGTFGNVRKGSLRGPGYFNSDVAVFKNFPVHGDRAQLQFRMEYFNVLNRANLNGPVNSVSGSGLGQILSAQDPRIGQLSLKMIF